MLTHEFQMRDATIKGRTLTILAAPFDDPAPVLIDGEPVLEQFARGAFTHLLGVPERTALRYEHQQSGPPYATGQELREDTAGLVGTWRVADSPDGQRLLALVQDDQLRGASVGFIPGDRPGDKAWVRNVLTHNRVKQLPEVSLTTAPVYEAAKVLEMRARRPDRDLVKIREQERWKWRSVLRH